jgi:hypothetical protein
MNGRARRGDRRWMPRATSSLPVPLSPSMSTVLDTGAYCSICTSTCRIASLSPYSPDSSARRRRSSSRRAAAATSSATTGLG